MCNVVVLQRQGEFKHFEKLSGQGFCVCVSKVVVVVVVGASLVQPGCAELLKMNCFGTCVVCARCGLVILCLVYLMRSRFWVVFW